METVLGDLVLGDLLEEDPRADSLGVLQGGGAVAQLRRDVLALQEVVPGGERVVARRELDAGRPRVDVAERFPPEGRQAPWVVRVEGDLEILAHRDAPSGCERVCR
ncbi:hypothetical protein GCM10028784_24070 [Myceligenerans cantabricum]